jgi:hypothetical protein
MKKLFFVLLMVAAGQTLAQESQSTISYNVFKSFQCENCLYRYFVSSNAGVLNTPLGYKVGFFGKTGGYLGARFGSGKIEHWETNTVTHTRLFSVTAGIIKPLFINNNVALHTYVGAGYGQWFNNRRDYWTASGYEIETGLMFSYKRIVLSIGGAVLDGARTYPKWDGTAGIGVRF